MIDLTDDAKNILISNVFENLHFSKDEEIVNPLFCSGNVRIERICSSGQVSEIYDQKEDEWVVLLEGEAELFLLDEGRSVRLLKGDSLFIPAHQRHQVTFTSEQCVWLCFFWTV